MTSRAPVTFSLSDFHAGKVIQCLGSLMMFKTKKLLFYPTKTQLIENIWQLIITKRHIPAINCSKMVQGLAKLSVDFLI